MDEKLNEILEQKIKETFTRTDEISKIIKSLEELSINKDSFSYGIIIGRLYNSFHYQCRRILNRNPTQEEFSEFLEILKQRQKEFLEKFH